MTTFRHTVRAAIVAAILALGTGAFAQSDASMAATARASEPDVRFILRTARIDGMMGFVGAGGDIDRVINPTLTISEGDAVEIVLLNGDGKGHYFIVEELHVGAPEIRTVGDRTTISFVADRSGSFRYSCALANHRTAGMSGELVVQADADGAL